MPVRLPSLTIPAMPLISSANAVPLTNAGTRLNFTLPDPSGNGRRTLRVFLPPSYEKNSRQKYPLLLMQDGQNLFEDKTAFMRRSWRLGETAQAGMLEGSLREFITVGIDNAREGRFNEYTPWPNEADGESLPGGGAKQYLDWLESTVLPELERRYNLSPDRESRVIGGSSLGAVLSLCALMQKPQLFAGAMLMSTSWNWQNPVNGTFLAWMNANFTPASGSRVWMSIGSEEINLDSTNEARNILREKGLTEETGTLGYEVFEGGTHGELSWRQQVHRPLEFFFGK